jgi:hypothetical protein
VADTRESDHYQRVRSRLSRVVSARLPLGHQFWWNLTFEVTFHRPAQVSGTLCGTPAGLDRRTVPTLAAYLPSVIAAAGPGANRTYGSYWIRRATIWGDRRLDQIAASDIEALSRSARPVHR